MFHKWIKRIIPVLLCAAILLSSAACSQENTSSERVETIPENLPVDISGNVVGSPVVERSYTTLNAENNSLLDFNPNRGLRGIIEFYHFNYTDDEIYTHLQNDLDKFSKYTACSTYVLYLYPGDYLGAKLPDEFFETTQKIFDFLRENQIQILLRFAYYDVNTFNKRTPTTEELMLHINQLAENGIIERNKDIIHVFQAGFIGKFGEWHSDEPRADRSLIVNAIIEKLLPEGISLQLRNPRYREFISEENFNKVTLSFNDDAFFGIQNGTELGNQDYSVGLEPWEYQKNNAYNAPNDAELYYWSQFTNEMGFFPDGYACVLGAAEHHLTTLSANNGYLDQGPFKDGAMVRWKNQPVTEKWLNENGLAYSENWFKSAAGETVERSVFDYLRDYVGYRLSAQKLSVKKSGESKIQVELTLQNHGLSAAFNITSQLVILDQDGNEVASVEAGNPAEWYTTDPTDYNNRKQLDHTITAQLELPQKSGEYRLGLKLLSKGGATARLDNKTEFSNGCNILHEFSIE